MAAIVLTALLANVLATHDPIATEAAEHAGPARARPLAGHRQPRPGHLLADRPRGAGLPHRRRRVDAPRLRPRRGDRAPLGLRRRPDRPRDPARARHPAGAPAPGAGAGDVGGARSVPRPTSSSRSRSRSSRARRGSSARACSPSARCSTSRRRARWASATSASRSATCSRTRWGRSSSSARRSSAARSWSKRPSRSSASACPSPTPRGGACCPSRRPSTRRRRPTSCCSRASPSASRSSGRTSSATRSATRSTRAPRRLGGPGRAPAGSGDPRPAAMTEPGDAVPVAGTDAADPRRLVLADLVGASGRGRDERAPGATRPPPGQADGALRAGARGARPRQARPGRRPRLPLARALGVPVATRRAGAPLPRPRWGVILGEAFQGERALERTGRELAALARRPPPEGPGGPSGRRRAAQHGEGGPEALPAVHLGGRPPPVGSLHKLRFSLFRTPFFPLTASRRPR